MTAFFIYLLKVSGWIAAGWLVYHFFLRNEKFYTFNRAYLMTGLAVSFLIPLVKIHYPVKIFMVQTSTVTIAGNAQTPTHPVDIYSILFYIYIFCIGFLIIRQLFLLLKIRALIHSAGYTVVDNFRLVHSSESKITFSFFNYIFLNFRQIPEVERQLILAHERSHIFQRHWIDLAVAESACILLWFNPFAWFYLRSVKENHEYLADEAVIRNGYSPVFYRAALINQSFNASVFPLVNSFSHYKFKRIAMMKKETSNPLKKLAVMLLIPAACLFLWAFSEPEYHATTIEPSVSQKDTIMARRDSTASPLIIIDGKETSSSLKEIDNELTPDQIDSICIIKDASASKIYGDRGKNGVVSITTKNANHFPKDSTVNKKMEFLFSTDSGTYITKGTYTTCSPKNQNSLMIRGLDLSSPPLYIVDGKEIPSSSAKEINSNRIESVNVLGERSATDVYGEKGKNGVVIITMKRMPTTAATIQVSGTVTDAKDDTPLPGVAILAKGSNTGAVTDLNGKYSLDIPADAVLQFSYINMATQEIPVLNGKIINIAMNNAETQANDTIQANITVINSKYGENAHPLYIVDGEETESIANISVNEIKSISVLKDQSATAEYGDKGKNGVVIIRTKK